MYTVGMMKITKTEETISFPPRDSFEMRENTVQGARIGVNGNAVLIASPRRYKLFTEGCDRVKVLDGKGFFKWKRGETPFAAGDCFEVDAVGEYELNGSGVFIVLKG